MSKLPCSLPDLLRLKGKSDAAQEDSHCPTFLCTTFLSVVTYVLRLASTYVLRLDSDDVPLYMHASTTLLRVSLCTCAVCTCVSVRMCVYVCIVYPTFTLLKIDRT